MKRNIIFGNAILCALLVASSCKKETAVSKNEAIADKNKTSVSSKYSNLPRTKSGILTYISESPGKGRLIAGQQVGDGNSVSSHYTNYIGWLNTQTGIRPALAGFDYGFTGPTDLINNINPTIKSHWNAGGLVTVMFTADNPFEVHTGGKYSPHYNNGEGSANSYNASITDLRKLHVSAGPSTAKTNYWNELVKAGDALVDLQNAGVIVLWRPFHEMNRDFFWWSSNALPTPTNIPAYKQLWIDMYNYLVGTRKLTNLIWVYSPFSLYGSTWGPKVTDHYPGAGYVDIVGIDIYSAQPQLFDAEMTELRGTGKPVAICENGSNKGDGSYNNLAAAQLYKGKAAYFMTWASWEIWKDGVKTGFFKCAIKDNINYNSMLWEPYVVCID